ncbi:hypothetical protein KIN20_003913 [Parelaphostrongylus tenuis]|uniref:SSD domain-containing protein n=1 Tax=Parelaphostrongylus tenuis TaxID=148309 RepID=A0AAD5QIX7_PARTN|nr:hypothetical protein KIN20_003913 [Parelaphostrongylus tenuis]
MPIYGRLISAILKNAKVSSQLKLGTEKLLRWYTGLVADTRISFMIIFVWTIYVGGAIVGLFFVNIDLSPQKVFLPDSNVIETDRIRNKYVIPFYTPATIVVSNPGNISDPENVRELFAVKRAFESIPDAIGPESTKFFLSDYIKYEATLTNELGDEANNVISIDDFLQWPEYSYWKGFVKRGNKSIGSHDITQFIFITGYHGADLALWGERARLLRKWREQVDHFAKRFNLSVFTEDGFYIDLLESIPSITWQSALATFISVVFVCSLFISRAATVVFVAMSVFATCTGVFSYMSMFGMTLDPMVMAISIMCIGFSVDIPAHVSFHFHAARFHTSSDKSFTTLSSTSSDNLEDFQSRLLYTLYSIGFPVIQAGVSTNLCVFSAYFHSTIYGSGVCTRHVVVHFNLSNPWCSHITSNVLSTRSCVSTISFVDLIPKTENTSFALIVAALCLMIYGFLRI